jgi:hypothetical protein
MEGGGSNCEKGGINYFTHADTSRHTLLMALLFILHLFFSALSRPFSNAHNRRHRQHRGCNWTAPAPPVHRTKDPAAPQGL